MDRIRLLNDRDASKQLVNMSSEAICRTEAQYRALPIGVNISPIGSFSTAVRRKTCGT